MARENGAPPPPMHHGLILNCAFEEAAISGCAFEKAAGQVGDLRPVRRLKFLHDVAHMHFHCAFAHVQLIRDQFVRHAAAQAVQICD